MEDRELIAQILKGNQHAFTFLVRKYEKLVLHMVVRVVKQETVIEDVCQEVFIKVYQNLKKFRGDAKLSTWIAKIAYNVSLNHLRKEEKEVLATYETLLDNSELKLERLPDKFLENKELKKRIVREIDALPVTFRTLATLFYLEEFSYEEIEKITGIKQVTIRSYLSRTRALLKQKLIFVLKDEI